MSCLITSRYSIKLNFGAVQLTLQNGVGGRLSYFVWKEFVFQPFPGLIYCDQEPLSSCIMALDCYGK